MQIHAQATVESLVADPFANERRLENLTLREQIELLEAALLKCAQVEIPVEHVFAPGVYMRQGKISKGTFLIGHMHHTEHLNIVFSGRLTVMMEGKMSEVAGPAVFKSAANVRKVIYAHEDSVMANIHPTTETDLAKLEKQLVVKSETHQLFHEGLKSQLMLLAESIIAQRSAIEGKE